MAIEQTQDQDGGMRTQDLARALARAEIDVHFQPKVDLRSGRVIGVEALARWQHPDLGLLAASDFIDDVEPGHQMRSLTERVIELSTRAAGDWWRSGLRLQLAVNVAPSLVAATDWDLAGTVEAALSSAGLPGEAIQFDITEDALLADPDRASQVLQRLVEHGGGISIDDFGTGYFSLRELIALPIDELKIDTSLILGLDDDENKMIARAIIHLAHQLGLPVVAEGVETRDTWQQLRSMGCERAQGFLIAKPLASREVPAWLATWNHRARELSPTRGIRRRNRRAAKAASPPAEATA